MSIITNVEDILLRRPFPLDLISFKPLGFGANAKAFAHADPRAYFERLNEVFGSDWGNEVQILEADDRFVAINTLRIRDKVCRCDVGEADKNFTTKTGQKSNANAATTAQAQAFKRSCVSIGMGEYLYHMDISKGSLTEMRNKMRTPEQRFWEAMDERNLVEIAKLLSDGESMSDIFNKK